LGSSGCKVQIGTDRAASGVRQSADSEVHRFACEYWPVAATVGILFSSWIWRAAGLLLAAPLTAFVKVVADCNPLLIHISNLLAETARPMPRWAPRSDVTVSRAIPFLREHFRAKAKS